MSISVHRAADRVAIDAAVASIMEEHAQVLPPDRGARVLLKPNLNSHMNALTGNTTDLRVLGAVLRELRRRGYGRLVVAEGTNSGFYRHGISVIDRLKVRSLAAAYGAEVLDLNHREGHPIAYENGARAHVARDVLEADCLISIPKLKTHFEVGISCCLKNLMGTLVGQDNKKATHQNLAANILNINAVVRPSLHVVDGVIAMEGLGPTRGTPRKLGLVLGGTDPYLVDLAVARIAGFAPHEVRTLALARTRGLVTDAMEREVASMALPVATPPFERPQPSLLARFFHAPSRQPFFFKVRATQPFPYLASTRLGHVVLYRTGLRQDVFVKDDARIESVRWSPELCRDEGACRAYCPLPLELPRDVGNREKGCIDCLYCAQTCPSGAISYEGAAGFLQEQERQYGDIVTRLGASS